MVAVGVAWPAGAVGDAAGLFPQEAQKKPSPNAKNKPAQYFSNPRIIKHAPRAYFQRGRIVKEVPGTLKGPGVLKKG
jgi:hypothetical protein